VASIDSIILTQKVMKCSRSQDGTAVLQRGGRFHRQRERQTERIFFETVIADFTQKDCQRLHISRVGTESNKKKIRFQ